MVSSALGIAQFAAVKQADDHNSGSILDRCRLPKETNLGSETDAIALKDRALGIALSLLVDSFLLLNADGGIILSNAKGEELLQKMQTSRDKSSRQPQVTLPEAVLKACDLLLENCAILSDQSLPTQVALTVYPNIQLRISLIETEDEWNPLFLVVMEDKQQSSLTQATVDQWLFGLTNREKEVWTLRLQDYAYQEIAETLYLSVNTVKRHMKAILAKQEQWRYDTFELLAS
ncbi:hypothetical protein C7293_02880 [filamentous cyanobacterium CCT1]|nr:hypothetical protein C7293_02880 [filamentous cyanobacterium CCT1]PSN80117.1 hypothetical protein C8B47_08070 [filamentous cyanobacterium CCP4]